MPIIEMPDGQQVEFPDTMPDAQIRGLIAQRYPREVGEIGASMPLDKRITDGHYAFDGSNVPGYDQETGMVPDPYDGAKSFGAGLRRGVEGLAGIRGDVNQAQGGIVGWLAGKLGADPETQKIIRSVASKVSPMPMVPGSQDYRDTITDPLFGKSHEPQTTEGEYARTIGEFGVGALAPGGPIRKLAMAVVPGVASEAAGQYTEGTPYETAARIGAGLAGGLAAAPRLAATSATRLAAKEAGTGTKALTRIIKQMQRDGLSPADIQRKLRELGPDATLMDVGPNLRQEGQRIYAKGGEGRGIIDQTLTARDQTANARIRGEVNANLGPAPVPSQINDGIAANQRSLDPVYRETVRNGNAVDTQGIANALESDIVNLRGSAQATARRVRGMLNVEGADVLDPSPSTLHETRKAIDGMLATEADPNTIRVLTRARQEVDNVLAQSVPGLKDVDAQFSELARQHEALGRGQQVLDSGRTAPRPTELARDVQEGALPRGNQIGPSAVPVRLREGARAEIERIIGTNANDRVALQKLIKGEGDWNRDRLATLFGQDRADRVVSVVDRERTFAETSNRVMKNSATAERMPENNPSGVREAFMAGGPKSLAWSAMVRGVESAVDKFRGASAAARDADVARLLTPEDKNRLVTALLKANGGKPMPQAQIDAAVRQAVVSGEAFAAAREKK